MYFGKIKLSTNTGCGRGCLKMYMVKVLSVLKNEKFNFWYPETQLHMLLVQEC